MRILIAEDEQRTRQGLVRVLQSLRDEYEIVAQASNGKAALEMILEQKPDVVFIEYQDAVYGRAFSNRSCQSSGN